jgi:hypothetical protein
MGIKLTNNAFATLAAGINSSATSITLTSGQGARFPTLTASDYFYATLIDTSNNLEIVKCTARSTDVLTVVRAQETTTARAYSTGDRIEIRLTAATFIDAVNEIGPTQVSDEANTATGYFALPSGTTAQRPASPVNGMLRYNTTIGANEIYQSGQWIDFATPSVSSVSYLTIAGGGGGGHGTGSPTFSGGGAGGVLQGTASVTPNTAYTITVGGGGTGGGTGTNGANSSAFGQTAIGGGYGGGGGMSPGGSGGSGGGQGGSAGGGTANNAAGTAGQGNQGGSGTTPQDGAGGGGGFSSAGENASGATPGNGGNGLTSSISGTSTTYAGGGGRTDRGFRGGYIGSPTAAANSGSGGGGAAGNGGSGIVIISYANTFKAASATGTYTFTNTGGNYVYAFTSSGTITF